MGIERVGSILIGADEIVAQLVASRIPGMEGRSFGQFTALGVIRDERLIGGVVYHAYMGHDVQVSIALDRPTFMPWRALFDYPFNQLGVRRITAITGRKYKKTRGLLEKLGFRLEGVHKRGLDGFQDSMSYAMLKEHCRWLRGKHGKESPRSYSAA